MSDRSPGGGAPSDRRERRQAWVAALGIAGVLALAVLAMAFVPALAMPALTPGLGLKTAAIIGFAVTFVVFVVFAVAAGDGVFGELPLMLAGFLFFWAIFSVTVAWAF